jgi:peptidylprolyl isomerase
MAAAKLGDTVHIHYTGRLDDGSVFDASAGREPLAFELGTGRVIPGFERAVLGMRIGERKTVRILAEEAYGVVRDELRFFFPRERLPEGMNPEVGTRLQLTDEGGHPVPVTVVENEAAGITVDANHELAGKALTFELELVLIG